MKKFIAPVSLALLLFSCRQEQVNVSTDAELLAAKIKEVEMKTKLLNKEYQTLNPSVRFYIEPDSKIPDIESQNLFISKSGLPLRLDFFEWQKDHDLSQAISLYTSYIEKHANDKYINTFRQYQGWLLLTHYDLLSTNTRENEVLIITKELIRSKYTGYGQLYHALNYLIQNRTISETEAADMYSQVKSYAENPKQITDRTEIELSNSSKPVPAEVRKLIAKRTKEKVESLQYVEKINILVH